MDPGDTQEIAAPDAAMLVDPVSPSTEQVRGSLAQSRQDRTRTWVYQGPARGHAGASTQMTQGRQFARQQSSGNFNLLSSPASSNASMIPLDMPLADLVRFVQKQRDKNEKDFQELHDRVDEMQSFVQDVRVRWAKLDGTLAYLADLITGLEEIAPDKVAPDQAAHAAQASTDADGQEAQTPPNNLETLQALVQREEGADMVRGTVFGTKMVGMMDRFEALQVQFALMKKELDDLGDLLDDMGI
ncbi:hypothetical protein C8Q76DRAFT_795171 [Earliella scabrosa]|nr:hypothetical protein C8Q76DRAFT_795171 [Earliella scabrosa]